MKLKIILFGFFLLASNLIIAQVPFPHTANSAGSNKAERVSRFGVNGVNNDFFEITNATVDNNEFLPALWAHSGVDTGHVMQIHGTTTRGLDSGTQPLIKFIASITPGLVLSAPNGAQFPWGNGGTQQTVNSRPTFSWLNGNNTVMLLSAQNNLGIGTTSPSARLHTNGTVRFQNLPNGKIPTYILGTDSNGNVKEFSPNIGGRVNCNFSNFLIRSTRLGGTTCSQVYDNGSRAGIGTTTPAHKLSVNGNIHSMSNIFISDKKFKKNIAEIQSPLEIILKLNGKKYDWRASEFKKFDFIDRKQIGFIAQEVKEIIPEIVYVDEKGEHSMNYTAIIPILVEAIKEQQNQITLLQNKLSGVKLTSSSENGLTIGNKTSFSTNYPNPFSATATVDYYIMKNVNNARIIIYDSNGTTISTYNLDDRGKKSQLVINKNRLKTGIYFYTLITDNIVIGTKKMIVK